jgi:hypothetical protein
LVPVIPQPPPGAWCSRALHHRVKGTDGRTWGQVADDQRLGVDIGPANSAAKYKIGFPTFQ